MGRQDPIGVGLIGCGTVGSGVVKLLLEEADLYAQRLGRPLALVAVLVREGDKANKTQQVPEGLLTSDPESFFATEGLDMVVELAGGKTAALDLVRRALAMGKHVVTANKALLAAHAAELFALARQHGVAVGFEASCGGGIPIITAMQMSLVANRITAIYAILNGTCNHILTEMSLHGRSYESVLAEAQQAGYAEADPSLDVSGGDSAHKLAILATLAFGAQVTDDQIPCRGIDALRLEDIRFGAELGYQIKLLAIGEKSDAGLSLGVAPGFLHADNPLARITGPFNAISLYGHAVGHTLYCGRGAGQMPTAGAIVGDLLSIAAGAYTSAFQQMGTWADQQEPAQLLDPKAVVTRYYLRFNAMDRPGVLAAVTSILSDESICIASVLQHEEPTGRFVPVVITTHRADTGAVERAAEKIAAMEEIEGPPVAIRIVDLPEG